MSETSFPELKPKCWKEDFGLPKCLEALKAVSLSQVFSDYPLASGSILFLSKCIILVSLPVIRLFILVCLSCVLLLTGSV